MEYLDDKIWRYDRTCVDMLRMNKARFFRFCQLCRIVFEDIFLDIFDCYFASIIV